MNKARLNKNLRLLMLSGLLIMTLTGCGKKVDVVITDQYTKTLLSTKEGNTVSELLAAAEIKVDSDDSVEPELDKVIDKDADIEIKRNTKVIVAADGKETVVELLGGKVSDALGEAEVSLGENDSVDCHMDAFLKDNMKIIVERRVKAKVTVDGSSYEVLSSAKNVEELLKEQMISVGEKDEVAPEKTELLYEGIEIIVKRKEVKQETLTETIDFETKTEYSSSLASGTTKITSEGKAGEKEVTYEITYVDGKEESRKVIKEEVIKEPQDQVVTKGTKKSGKEIVSKEKVYDCDGSGHGYYIITYADGTVKYEDF